MSLYEAVLTNWFHALFQISNIKCLQVQIHWWTSTKSLGEPTFG